MTIDYAYIFQQLNNPLVTKVDYDENWKIMKEHIRNVWEYILTRSDRHYLDDNQIVPKYDIDMQWDKINIRNVNDFSEFETYLDGKSIPVSNPYYPYNDSFPTSLLFQENWKQIVNDNIDQSIEKHCFDRIKKLDQNKIKKENKKIRQKEQLKTRKRLIDSLTNKVKNDQGNYILDQEEFDFLMQNIYK